jgi:hypothetical protein
MKKIFNKICGIQLPNANELYESLQEDSEQQDIIGFITFSLLRDGTVFINSDWTEKNDNMVDIYAQFLYKLNNGSMEDGILKILIEAGINDVKKQYFITKIINKIEEYKQQSEETPIISPSETFRVQNAK